MSHGIINRRKAVQYVGVAVTSSWLYGCGDDAVNVDMKSPKAPSAEPDVMMPRVVPEPMLSDLTGLEEWEKAGVLTPSEPGEWADKIAGHYPIAVLETDGVRVSVAHPMDEDHYISTIYLKDAAGRLITVKELEPGDEPTAFFEGYRPDAMAYAVCNLHQVWKAPVVRTQDLPGPWAGKINGHTPRIKMVGNEVSVKVPHPMDPEHYIVAIYVTDQNGKVIGKTQLKPGDEASYTLTVEPGCPKFKRGRFVMTTIYGQVSHSSAMSPKGLSNGTGQRF